LRTLRRRWTMSRAIRRLRGWGGRPLHLNIPTPGSHGRSSGLVCGRYLEHRTRRGRTPCHRRRGVASHRLSGNRGWFDVCARVSICPAEGRGDRTKVPHWELLFQCCGSALARPDVSGNRAGVVRGPDRGGLLDVVAITAMGEGTMRGVWIRTCGVEGGRGVSGVWRSGCGIGAGRVRALQARTPKTGARQRRRVSVGGASSERGARTALAHGYFL
jgi:hypothetical protein